MGHSVLIYRGLATLIIASITATSAGLYMASLVPEWEYIHPQRDSLKKQLALLEEKILKADYHQKFLEKNKELESYFLEHRFFSPPIISELRQYVLKKATSLGVSLNKFTLHLVPCAETSFMSACYEMEVEGTCIPDISFYRWLDHLENGWGHFKVQELVMGRAYLEEEITPMDFQLKASFGFFHKKEPPL